MSQDIDDLVAALEGAKGDRIIYALRRVDSTSSPTLNRIAGSPAGIGSDRWPTLDDEPMRHLLTLDLATVPEVAARLPGQRTLSLFCLDPEENEAFEPFNEEAAIVLSTEEQVARGVLYEPEGAEWDTEPSAFEVVSLSVPGSIFTEFADEVPEEHRELRELVYRLHGRAGGEPIWLQSAEHEGTFVLQFDEEFVPMNLGDGGIMYVFADAAFWQCH